MTKTQTTYSQEVIGLSQAIAEREFNLKTLTAFEAAGGRFRMSVTVDHSDPCIKHVVEGIAKEHFPDESLMKHLRYWAEKDLEVAKLDLLDRASHEHLQAKPAEEPKP